MEKENKTNRVVFNFENLGKNRIGFLRLFLFYFRYREYLYVEPKEEVTLTISEKRYERKDGVKLK